MGSFFFTSKRAIFRMVRDAIVIAVFLLFIPLSHSLSLSISHEIARMHTPVQPVARNRDNDSVQLKCISIIFVAIKTKNKNLR